MSYFKFFCLIPFLSVIGCADITAEADVQIDHVFDYSGQVITAPLGGEPVNYTQCFDFDISNVLKKVASEQLTVSNISDTMQLDGNVTGIVVVVSLVNRGGASLPVLGPIALFSAEEAFKPTVDSNAFKQFLMMNDNQICVNISGPSNLNFPTSIHNDLIFHLEGTAKGSL